MLLGVINLAVILLSAPHNWDSMTYHLARVAYYLQHNSTEFFDANYWAQVVQPKNSALLLVFTYLVSGRNENLTQLVQFVSYWVAVCSVYAISRKAGSNRTGSIFAAAVSAMLIEWLMQATTTQNDLILTAFFGVMVYFLFAFRETREWKYLALTALGIGLSIGTKASSLPALLSVVLIALYAIFRSKINLRRQFGDFCILASCTLAAICLFALPSGYIENYLAFGNPSGPNSVTEIHTFEGQPVGYIAKNGTRNLLRYGFDFLSLDGLPPINPIREIQTWLRFLPKEIVSGLGLSLDTYEATRAPFEMQKMPTAHEDNSYWGIFGFGLVWIVVLLSLFGAIKSTDIRVLSLAAVVFLIAQAYLGPYDPWRGRYFTVCAVFAVPTIGIFLRAKNRFVRAYLVIIVLIGSLSATSAVVLRSNSSLVTFNYQELHTTSIFTMDRIQQLTRNRTAYTEPLEAFDRLVPGDATVAVFLNENSFEYPLFGEYLTRTILPINSFTKGRQPIPSSADYLLYTQNGFPCTLTDDVHLGADWYLRRLTDTNRGCP
jgi:hypothetical protein